MKLGIVFEGGASRGYFSAGVMDKFLDFGIRPDYVIGASAGIANGVSFISGQKGRNLIIGTKYLHDKRYMGMRHMLNRKNKSYYNIDFVFNDIPNKYLPFDYKAFESSQTEKIAVVTNIETGKAEYMPVPSNDKEWRLIVASCALPILFPPIEINGKKYFDGGIADSIPYKRALEDGCDKIIVVLTRERSYEKKDESTMKLAAFHYRKYPNLVKALRNRALNYNKCRNELLKLEIEGKALVIAPESTADWKRTEKRPNAIEKMYNEGVSEALVNENKIRDFISD